MGFDFKEKYSSHLCETGQAGSFPRLHPFESSDSHLPCNGQNVSLKIGILSQTLFVLFCRFSMAPSKGLEYCLVIMSMHYPPTLRAIPILHLCNVSWTTVLKGNTLVSP